MQRLVDPTVARPVQYDEWPDGAQLMAKYPGWKYWRRGVVVETHDRAGLSRMFHCTDGRGRPASYEMRPMAQYKLAE